MIQSGLWVVAPEKYLLRNINFINLAGSMQTEIESVIHFKKLESIILFFYYIYSFYPVIINILKTIQ
jgi:hypothetical protein